MHSNKALCYKFIFFRKHSTTWNLSQNNQANIHSMGIHVGFTMDPWGICDCEWVFLPSMMVAYTDHGVIHTTLDQYIMAPYPLYLGFYDTSRQLWCDSVPCPGSRKSRNECLPDIVCSASQVEQAELLYATAISQFTAHWAFSVRICASPSLSHSVCGW